MKRLHVYLALFIILTFISACGKEEPKQAGNHKGTESGETIKSEVPANDQEITISAVGDMLIHDSVYRDAKTANGYDFMPMLKQVKPFLKNATITFANQETMIGGQTLGLSSYPTFNSPAAVGDALKEVGVDVVSIANNHTLDRGETAIQNAIRHWEKIDMMYTGAYKNEKDRQRLRIYNTDEGISVAFLAYTYGTNGIPVPAGKDYLVNLIDKERIEKQVKEAKEKADTVVLSLHFGNEYERLPSQQQQDLVQFAADQGVDVVLGHHPHVLQPIDWVKGANGNKTLVAYSLGNFLSGQDEFYRRIGGIINFTIVKTTENGQKKIEVNNPAFMPTFVKFNNWANYEVVPMYQLTQKELANAKQHYHEIKEHMSQWVPELTFIEN